MAPNVTWEGGTSYGLNTIKVIPEISTFLAGPVVKDERLDGGLVVDLDLSRHRGNDLVHLRHRVLQAAGDAR